MLPRHSNDPSADFQLRTAVGLAMMCYACYMYWLFANNGR